MVEWEFSDEIRNKKTIYLILTFLFSGAGLLWFMLHPLYAAIASLYLWIYVLAVMAFVLNFITKAVDFGEMISVSFWQENSLLGPIEGKKQVAVIIGSFLFAVFVFFWVLTTKTSIVGAPQHLMQAAELGVVGDVFITTAAAIAENMFFFYTLMPIFFAILFYITKSPILSFVLTIFIIAPSIFTIYHSTVYGTALESQSISVYIFGMVNSFVVFILRQPVFTDFFHVANNLGVIFGKTVRIGFAVATGGGG